MGLPHVIQWKSINKNLKKMLSACQAIVDLVKTLFQGFCGYHSNFLKRCTVCSAHIEGLANAITKTEKDYATLATQFKELQVEHGKALQELNELKRLHTGADFKFTGPNATVSEYLSTKARLQPSPISSQLSVNNHYPDHNRHYRGGPRKFGHRGHHPYRGNYNRNRGTYPRGKFWAENAQTEPQPLASSTPSPSLAEGNGSATPELFEAAIQEATRRIEAKMQKTAADTSETSMANTTGATVVTKLKKMKIKKVKNTHVVEEVDDKLGPGAGDVTMKESANILENIPNTPFETFKKSSPPPVQDQAPSTSTAIQSDASEDNSD